MPTPEKVATVEKTKRWYRESVGMIFTDYSGLTVPEMQELRKTLRTIGAEFHVVKNTLFRIALGPDIEKLPPAFHNGTTATVFILAEQPACAKAILTFSKAHAALKIKGGFMEGRVLTAAEVDALAKLPSRNELLSMIVGLIAAPMSNVASVLQEVLAAPIRLIGAIADKQPHSQAAVPEQPAPAPSAVAEEQSTETPTQETDETGKSEGEA